MSSEGTSRGVRVYPCESITIGISDHSVKIFFALENSKGEPEDQTGVFMSHKTLKMLQSVLSSAVSAIESETGCEIPYDEDRMKNISDQIKAGIAKK